MFSWVFTVPILADTIILYPIESSVSAAINKSLTLLQSSSSGHLLN